MQVLTGSGEHGFLKQTPLAQGKKHRSTGRQQEGLAAPEESLCANSDITGIDVCICLHVPVVY